MKKILFAADGSENSEKAFLYVKDLAKALVAKVIILNSYELPSYYQRYETESILSDLESHLVKTSVDLSESLTKRLADENIEGISITSYGDAGVKIVEEATKHNVDLIVVGSRGLGGIKSFLLGSVSNYVLHHTDIPVLVIK